MTRLLFVIFAGLIAFAPARAEDRWMTLPPTPALPKPSASGLAPINGANIWYATFGAGPR